MGEAELMALKNFDFLARSFARMRAQGHKVDVAAITGNMTDAQRAWFCERFQRYCEQAQCAREQEKKLATQQNSKVQGSSELEEESA
jgi:hypothetical protein